MIPGSLLRDYMIYMPQKIQGLYATDPTYYREPETTIEKSMASELINHEKFVKDPGSFVADGFPMFLDITTYVLFPSAELWCQ